MEGAAANDLPDPLPDEVREERAARLMEVQEAISEARMARKMGQTLEERIGRYCPYDPRVWRS